MTIIRDGLQSADLDFPVASPTLNLDFTNSQSLDERIQFTRASVGTYVNKNGLISIASTNQPRFDHDPISGECKGLLIEEQRTNYVTNTNSLAPGGLTVITTNDISPDGSPASAYITDSNTSFHYITRYITPIGISSLPVGGTIDLTYSVFLKNYGVNNPSVLYGFETDDISNKYCIVKARSTTKTITSELVSFGWSVTNTKVEPYGNDWFRYSVSAQYTKAVGINTVYWLGMQVHSPSPADQQFYYGDNQTGIYIWGPQCEVGAFPTSYIPTSGSQVTRNPDNATMTGNNFTSWANTSVGSFVINGQGGKESDQNGFGNFIGLGGYGAISVRQGNDQTSALWDSTYSLTVYNSKSNVSNRKTNIAAVFNNYYRKIVLDGISATGNSSRNMSSTFYLMSLGSSGAGANYLNGTLSRVTYYPRELNDSQMIYLTQQ